MTEEEQDEARRRMALLTVPPGYATGPETEAEWIARAPTDPLSVARWARQAPPIAESSPLPPAVIGSRTHEAAEPVTRAFVEQTVDALAMAIDDVLVAEIKALRACVVELEEQVTTP